MNEYDALEWLRAIVSPAGLLASLVAFTRARSDLHVAEAMPAETREKADERVRRILRMHAALRWSAGVSSVLAGALFVAVLAIQNHPLLAVASNLNQILAASVLSLLAILQIHDRTAIVLISAPTETASEGE